LSNAEDKRDKLTTIRVENIILAADRRELQGRKAHFIAFITAGQIS
jgi:hypothetical protein